MKETKTSAKRGARVVSCPTCGKPVAWNPESRFRPFCSDRCKQIDLGTWASEGYRVADPESAADKKESD